MRNFVTNAVISNNVIEDCGIYDFQYQFDGKIGEAIYIGTSSNQVPYHRRVVLSWDALGRDSFGGGGGAWLGWVCCCCCCILLCGCMVLFVGVFALCGLLECTRGPNVCYV